VGAVVGSLTFSDTPVNTFYVSSYICDADKADTQVVLPCNSEVTTNHASLEVLFDTISAPFLDGSEEKWDFENVWEALPLQLPVLRILE